jgi:hypothetical protein
LPHDDTETPPAPARAAALRIRGPPSGERADILETLRTHRIFLRHTVEGLTDEQARLPRRPASSPSAG